MGKYIVFPPLHHIKVVYDDLLGNNYGPEKKKVKIFFYFFRKIFAVERRLFSFNFQMPMEG